MRSSEQTASLSAALAAFQGAIKAIPKTAENPFYKSKYAPLDEIVGAVRTQLSENGLSVTQGVSWDGGVDLLCTRLMHESGEWIEECCRLETRRYNKQGEETPPTMQNVGAAVTYMRRMAYSAILGLVTDDDNDGNANHQDASGRQDRGNYAEKPANDGQIGKLRVEIKKAGLDPDKEAVICTRVLGREIKSIGELTSRDASKVIDWLIEQQEGSDAA